MEVLSLSRAQGRVLRTQGRRSGYSAAADCENCVTVSRESTVSTGGTEDDGRFTVRKEPPDLVLGNCVVSLCSGSGSAAGPVFLSMSVATAFNPVNMWEQKNRKEEQNESAPG